MDYLGYLVWWRVGAASLPARDLPTLVPQLGFTVPPPAPGSPTDAFRKLAGEESVRPQPDGTVVTVSLHRTNTSDAAREVRHIVRTVRKDKAVQTSERVGDVVFYRAPKGEPSKARFRAQATSSDPQVKTYASWLRHEYQARLDTLDSQGIRRLIRAHLAEVNALSIDGPYFVQKREHVEPLMRLFTSLNDDCSIYWLPLAETGLTRDMLSTAIEHAVTDGSKTSLVEAYVPLGVVPESVWARLEKE